MVAVQTERIRPGQILAEEVRDVNGRLLLAGGTRIQPNHIRIFKIWGISQVIITGAAPNKEEGQPKAKSEATRSSCP